jgi:hypothetical protein
MSLPRLLIAFALVFAVLLSFLASRESAAPPATISARELLDLAQGTTKTSYTFDRVTSSALAAAQVPRPADDASPAALESALREAGFVLKAVGRPEKKVFLVERAGG